MTRQALSKLASVTRRTLSNLVVSGDMSADEAMEKCRVLIRVLRETRQGSTFRFLTGILSGASEQLIHLQTRQGSENEKARLSELAFTCLSQLEEMATQEV